jgi:hypothetical protein
MLQCACSWHQLAVINDRLSPVPKCCPSLLSLQELGFGQSSQTSAQLPVKHSLPAYIHMFTNLSVCCWRAHPSACVHARGTRFTKRCFGQTSHILVKHLLPACCLFANLCSCSAAAGAGHIQVLAYMRAQDSSCCFTDMTAAAAAAAGELGTLQWGVQQQQSSVLCSACCSSPHPAQSPNGPLPQQQRQES